MSASLELGRLPTSFGLRFMAEWQLITSISLKSRSVHQIGAALAIGLVLGLAILRVGPYVALGGVIGLTLLVLAFVNPEIVILVILYLATGLVPARFNPDIGLGIGHFLATDLLLIMLLSVVVFRLFTDKAFRFVRTPLDIPFLLFCGAVIIGMATAVLSHGIRFRDATYEARILLYYLIFFAITHHIRTKPQLFRLIHGILLIGLLAAGVMIAQAILGRSFLLVEAEALQGSQLIRFYYPAGSAVVVSLMVLTCIMAIGKDPRYRLISILAIPLLGLALLLTLTRNVLVSIVVGLAVMLIILRRNRLSRLVGNLLVIAGIVITIVALLGITGNEALLSKYVSTFSDRISSMFSERILSSEETLDWRWKEAQPAWTQIVQNPVFGIGFETPYRKAFFMGDLFRHFIHNGYLWIWLKTGLLGLIPFLWLSACFLVRGFSHWRDIQDNLLKAVTLGFILAYLATLMSNLVVSSVASNLAAVVFGAMMGVNEVAFTLMKPISKPG
jgi:O-antigen ligase